MAMILAQTNVQNVWEVMLAISVLVAVMGGIGIAAGGLWYALRTKQWEMSLKHAI
jgi:hypothetical protein